MSQWAKVMRVVASAPSRSATLTLTERLSAITQLTSSMEYLARERDRVTGGLNDWAVMRQAHAGKPGWAVRTLDVIASRQVTTALHGARVAAAATLLLGPSARKPRLVANLVLAATSVALYPRHSYGTDGSDHVVLLVQSATAIARAGERHPETVDCCLWFIALQSVLSYSASGWGKLAGPAWRSGQALPGILRTESYGHRRMWQALQQHPRAAPVLGGGGVGMGYLFPLVFVGRGRMSRIFVAWAAAFHLANGRVMGLGRFVWSFISMHPAVLYATGEPSAAPRQDAGREERRDDLMPAVTAGLMTALVTGAMIAQARRRRIVRGRLGGEATLITSSGNTLRYRQRGMAERSGAVIIFEPGLLGTPEHGEWLVRDLILRWPVVTYRRAGCGASTYVGARRFSLDGSVQD